MKISLLELSVVAPGKTRHDAFRHAVELAQAAEEWGYSRIWVAEHHGGGSVAGRAPEVMIAGLAAETSSIRVGSGSVLLNHYSALKVAEVFCTLNEMYPGRIDLGAGRATTGPVLDLALQQDRSRPFRADSDEQIDEVVAWLEDSFPANHPFSRFPLHTIESLPELYLLGSSPWSAAAAARLGLRYVFAGFINQEGAPGILRSYHTDFVPWGGMAHGQPPPGRGGAGAAGEAAAGGRQRERGPVRVGRPEAILAVHVVCAETEEEARRQLAPVHVLYQNLARGDLRSPLPDPDAAVAQLGGAPPLERYRPGSGVPPRFLGGTPDQVGEQLGELAADLALEEIIIQDLMTDHEARLRSYELLSSLIG